MSVEAVRKKYALTWHLGLEKNANDYAAALEDAGATISEAAADLKVEQFDNSTIVRAITRKDHDRLVAYVNEIADTLRAARTDVVNMHVGRIQPTQKLVQVVRRCGLTANEALRTFESSNAKDEVRYNLIADVYELNSNDAYRVFTLDAQHRFASTSSFSALKSLFNVLVDNYQWSGREAALATFDSLQFVFNRPTRTTTARSRVAADLTVGLLPYVDSSDYPKFAEYLRETVTADGAVSALVQTGTPSLIMEMCEAGLTTRPAQTAEALTCWDGAANSPELVRELIDLAVNRPEPLFKKALVFSALRSKHGISRAKGLADQFGVTLEVPSYA